MNPAAAWYWADLPLYCPWGLVHPQLPSVLDGTLIVIVTQGFLVPMQLIHSLYGLTGTLEKIVIIFLFDAAHQLHNSKYVPTVDNKPTKTYFQFATTTHQVFSTRDHKSIHPGA